MRAAPRRSHGAPEPERRGAGGVGGGRLGGEEREDERAAAGEALLRDARSRYADFPLTPGDSAPLRV
jgi:hypothetical protein